MSKRRFETERSEFQERKHELVQEAALRDACLDGLQSRLYRMIDYAISRHDWYDELRNRFLQIGIGITAATAAAAAIVVKLSAESRFVISAGWLWMALVTLFVTGLTLVAVYNFGLERHHPYREVADIRSWYFIYNQPASLPIGLSPAESVAREQIDGVREAMERFVSRWLSLCDDKKSFITEDLEQVFILHLLQRYKFQQVKFLSRILTSGLMLSAAFFVVALLCVVFQ